MGTKKGSTTRYDQDKDASDAARADGIANAEAGAGADWMDAAHSAIATCCGKWSTFTTDEVWQVLNEAGVPAEAVREPRAMGAAMRVAMNEGLIVRTSRTRNSVRTCAHRRPMRVWESVERRGKFLPTSQHEKTMLAAERAQRSGSGTPATRLDSFRAMMAGATDASDTRPPKLDIRKFVDDRLPVVEALMEEAATQAAAREFMYGFFNACAIALREVGALEGEIAYVRKEFDVRAMRRMMALSSKLGSAKKAGKKTTKKAGKKTTKKAVKKRATKRGARS